MPTATAAADAAAAAESSASEAAGSSGFRYWTYTIELAAPLVGKALLDVSCALAAHIAPVASGIIAADRTLLRRGEDRPERERVHPAREIQLLANLWREVGTAWQPMLERARHSSQFLWMGDYRFRCCELALPEDPEGELPAVLEESPIAVVLALPVALGEREVGELRFCYPLATLQYLLDALRPRGLLRRATEWMRRLLAR